MEHVRRAAFGEGAPLADPEAMLLVDDDHREVAELDLLLDEGMRADHEGRVAGGDVLADEPALAGGQRAREERDAEAEAPAELFDREEVLLGERLRRCHQRRLPPGLDGPQERVQRDDGLPRADVPLEEPVHRRRAIEIAVDLVHRPLLVGRELERQRFAVRGDELAGHPERLG